jgi:predicted DNA-binding transcriptional regulator YafY
VYARRVRRADRLFQLVQLLRTRRFSTAADLGVELAVSARTVYRDVQDLVGSGVPIEGEAGVGYRLRPGYELPPLTFNADEIEALVLGARMVQAWGGTALAQAARSAITKVEAVLPEPLRSLLPRTALYAPAGPMTAELVRELDVLRRGITEQRKVRFHYNDAAGTASERSARPLGLYFWGAKWSLAAYCELRLDYRNFRPDRMREVALLEERFDGSDGIDLPAFLRQMAETAPE